MADANADAKSEPVTTAAVPVFCYGSNMLRARLTARCPSATRRTVGFVRGHVLRWHKLGRDRSGKCDALCTGLAADRVWGVVYAVTPSDKAALDRAEGLGVGYDEATVEVHGAGGAITMASLYRALLIDPTARPFDWYKAFVVHRARENGLPAAYVTTLEQTPATVDPDAGRNAANRLILQGSLR